MPRLEVSPGIGLLVTVLCWALIPLSFVWLTSSDVLSGLDLQAGQAEALLKVTAVWCSLRCCRDAQEGEAHQEFLNHEFSGKS